MPTYEHLKYNNNKIQVDSAIRDGNGAQIDTTYAKKADTSYQYVNASVEFTDTPSGDAFLSTYPYRGTFQSDRITANTYASITLSDAQSKSGIYAPFCVTGSHVLYIYARADVGTVVFPTINLGGGASAITMDYTPVEGGLNPITSGGVYTNCVRTSDDQIVAGIKTFTSRLQVKDVEPPYIILNSTLTNRTTNPASTVSIALAKIGTATTGQETTGYSNLVSRIGSDGVRDLALSVCNKLGNWVDLSLHNDVDGNGTVTCYTYSPHRAYSSASNDDVLVKAHVADMMAQMPLTSGTGTVYGGCTLENNSNPVRWYKVGRICTVIFAIKISSSYTSTYTQYCMATGVPAAAIGAYPYGSQGLSVDGQTDSGGALGYVNTSGHLYFLARAQNMAGKVLVGSVTYITA